MADDVHVILTREDRDALKRLLKMAGVADQQQHPVNVPNREKPPTIHVPSSTMNTDIYIAKGTVPAMSDAYDDEPGQATCDIYWIKNPHSGSPLLEDRLFDQVVFNVGEVGASGYFPVGRDKFGSWLVLGSGGSLGNEWIDFRVIGYCPDLPSGASQSVYAEVIGTSCHSSVTIGEVVLVSDPSLCWFTLPIELLYGLVGQADLAANDGNVTLVCADVPEIGACYWKVRNLCCREEQVY